MEEDTEQSYWASVKQEALDAWEQSGHDKERAQDALSENCDGSYWVIYYHAAAKCLEYSSNEDAIFEVYGGAPKAFEGIDSMGALVCRAAYYAFLADCQEELQDLIDVDSDDNDDSGDS